MNQPKWISIIILFALTGCSVSLDQNESKSDEISSVSDAGTACTYGQDWTCNDDNSVSALWGNCLASGTCECNATLGFELHVETGKCHPKPGTDGGYQSEDSGCNQPSTPLSTRDIREYFKNHREFTVDDLKAIVTLILADDSITQQERIEFGQGWAGLFDGAGYHATEDAKRLFFEILQPLLKIPLYLVE